MRPSLYLYGLLFAAIAATFFAVFAELLPIGQNRDKPRSVSEVFRTFLDNTTGCYSGSEILMGHRKFQARVSDGTLTFHGGAFTFLDLDDPATFVPYRFRFDGTSFADLSETEMADVAAHFARYGLVVPDTRLLNMRGERRNFQRI